MSSSRSTLIAIGGGELSELPEIRELIRSQLEKRKCRNLVIMTVGTSEPDGAAAKYQKIFSEDGVKKMASIDVSTRDDAFNERSLKILRDADAMYFTGGDQLNITSLLGGSPLHEQLHQKWKDGTVIAGLSAGAAMMSNSMITAGKSDAPPRVEGVTIAPGMGLISGTIIDTHFSQRGRHGRLMTAVAHYPQLLGLGIDFNTAAVFTDGKFKVAGEGVVTVIDGSQMRHSDLPYRKSEETIGMFGVLAHVLPAGYSFEIETRTPIAPPFNKLAGDKAD